MANAVARERYPRGPEPYRLEIVSAGDDLRCKSASGVSIVADRLLPQVAGSIDILLVPGGRNLSVVAENARVLAWFRRMAPAIGRLALSSTGVFILAATGLLNGRSVTTHWHECPTLTQMHPAVRVKPDRIYVKDGGVYSSAGAAAGIDLALGFIEEDLGREFAFHVAKMFVMFVRRSGGQSQFSFLLEAQSVERLQLRELMVWIAEHPEADLSVEALAIRSNMSTRNFSRTFRRSAGTTPARFVETIRVGTARRLLEETDLQIEAIARISGLENATSMRRSFLRTLGVLPCNYRQQLRNECG